MTNIEYSMLMPALQEQVRKLVNSRKISISEIDIKSILDGTAWLNESTETNLEKMRTRAEKEEAEKNVDRKAKLASFIESIPIRYRDSDLGRDFPADFLSCLRNGHSGLILGGNGIGKTRMAWALAIYWKRENPEITIQVVKGAELLSEVKAADGDWYQYIRHHFGNSKHLIIDEVDKIRGSETDWMLLTYLIDHRYEWKRQTIVIGTCHKDEAIRLIGQSSYSRLSEDGGMAYWLQGENRRKKP